MVVTGHKLVLAGPGSARVPLPVSADGGMDARKGHTHIDARSLRRALVLLTSALLIAAL
jgi:hypothetical protein